MAEHPAVVFLTAALARAEETAKAATAGPWKAHRYDWDGEGFEASIGHYSEADVVGHGYEGGGVVEWADAVFIEANNPVAALRRVAAERQILAEHPPGPGLGYPDEAWNIIPSYVCTTCRTPPALGRPQSLPWPCRTVLLLAQAWGWEGDGS